MKKKPRVSTFYEQYDRGRHALWMLWQYDKKAWETWSRAWRYGAVPCVCHGYGRPQDELGLLGKHSVDLGRVDAPSVAGSARS